MNAKWFRSTAAKQHVFGWGSYLAGVMVLVIASTAWTVEVDPASSADDADIRTTANAATVELGEQAKPWDYDPYRVLIWIATQDPRADATVIGPALRADLMRDFAAVWRFEIANAPAAVRLAADRAMADLNFEALVASDPVIAVKRNHPDAIRIRYLADVSRYVGRVNGTGGRIEDVKARAVNGRESLSGVADKFFAVDGDAMAVVDSWADPATEAVLLERGLAMTLTDPEPNLIELHIEGLVGNQLDVYDKIFIVKIDRDELQRELSVVELEVMMRYFGPEVEESLGPAADLPAAVGRAVTRAFSPTVRIDDAGTRSAQTLVRAGGLIVDPDSPAAISAGDVLMPMVRKNDRNGRPVSFGRVDWAYLLVTEMDGPKAKADIYAGRVGGIQGRKNRRTFRTARKVDPIGDSTLLRLHARGNPDEPLVGYEVYDKEFDSKSMTLVGRTDWDGRLRVEATETPLRLLYVKNGGAVLARLPLVPGAMPVAIADLGGDDVRLRAEAYIRGVQSAIVDLVAIRELFKARIKLRLEQGKKREAQDLLLKLRDQPTNQRLADDMGKKQSMFLKDVGRNQSQRRQIDEMFADTRELLSKHIGPRLIRELEAAVSRGTWPAESPSEE